MEVRNVCQHCPQCQKASPYKPLPAPLLLLLFIGVPYEWVGLDLVGQLPKSAHGHEFLLVIIDYLLPRGHPPPKSYIEEHRPLASTPLQLSWAAKRHPYRPGNPFVSHLIQELCQLLQVKHLTPQYIT